MKYLVASTAVTDVIHFSDSRSKRRVGGGAGWYALSGMLVWDTNALLISGIGEDFVSNHGNWFEQNNVLMDGLEIKHPLSPETSIQYINNGERTEKSLLGAEHYLLHESSIKSIKPFCKTCDGLYVFRNVNDMEFWQGIYELKKYYDFVLTWEIAADAALPEFQDRIKWVLNFVDILSINQSEAISLLGTDPKHIEKELAALGVDLVYYRRGKDGATMIQADTIVKIPRIDIDDSIDPTGAGNSSSGAVLVGYCQKRSLTEIGLMASISAGYTVIQYGPIPKINSVLRNSAKDLLKNCINTKGRNKNE